MEFVRNNILTVAALALGLLFTLLSFDNISSLMFGAAIGAFIFESGNAPALSEKIRKLVKL